MIEPALQRFETDHGAAGVPNSSGGLPGVLGFAHLVLADGFRGAGGLRLGSRRLQRRSGARAVGRRRRLR